MKVQKQFLVLVTLGLAGCGGPAGDDGATHDVKYRALATSGSVVEKGTGSCIEDTVTGLIWESKTRTTGLHNWQNRYTWFNPNEANDELDYRGLEDGGECTDSLCDTWNFVSAVNATGLCGYKDWRMPTRNELFSISDQRKASNPPTANVEYFPFTQADEYWTGFDYAMQYQSAWVWSFLYGHDRVDWKSNPKYVRLVRGEAAELLEVKE